MFLAVNDPPGGGAAPAAMSGTAVFALMLCGLLIDYSAFGRDSLRDRAAFLMQLAAWRVGWNDSSIDRFTVDTISQWIDEAKKTGNTDLAAAKTGDIIGVLVCLLAMYCAGCLMPTKASAKLGKFALLAFTPGRTGPGGPGGPAVPSKYRINWRLAACAALLGMLSELAHGAIGDATQQFIAFDIRLMSPIPGFLFGVS